MCELAKSSEGVQLLELPREKPWLADAGMVSHGGQQNELACEVKC